MSKGFRIYVKKATRNIDAQKVTCFDLPVGEQKIIEGLELKGIESYEIVDYEAPIKLDGYLKVHASIVLRDLNEVAELYDEYASHEAIRYLEEISNELPGWTYAEILKIFGKVSLTKFTSYEVLGEDFYDQNVEVKRFSNLVRKHIDFVSLGEELCERNDYLKASDGTIINLNRY